MAPLDGEGGSRGEPGGDGPGGGGPEGGGSGGGRFASWKRLKSSKTSCDTRYIRLNVVSTGVRKSRFDDDEDGGPIPAIVLMKRCMGYTAADVSKGDLAVFTTNTGTT